MNDAGRQHEGYRAQGRRRSVSRARVND
jgi:hypothetical protein